MTDGPRRRLGRGVAWGLSVAVLVVSGGIVWTTRGAGQSPARVVLRSSVDLSPLGFSPDGSLFATAGGDALTLWDTKTGRVVTSWEYRNEGWNPWAVFTRDGRAVAVFGQTKVQNTLSVSVFEVPSGRVLTKFTVPTGLALPLWALPLAFMDDGRTLRLARRSGATFEIADYVGSKPAVRSLGPDFDPVTPLKRSLSADGMFLAETARNQSVVNVFDVDAGARSSSTDFGTGGIMTWSSVSPGGKAVAVGRIAGTVDVRDTKTGRLVSRLPQPSPHRPPYWLKFSEDGGSVAVLRWYRPQRTWGNGVGFSPSRSRVLVDMVVFDAATGAVLGRGASAAPPIISPDGRSIAAPDSPHSIRILDVAPASHSKR